MKEKEVVKMENTKIKMRRQDREVTDNEKIKEIIKTCDYCRLGLNDNGKVYIVPLNFGFTEKNGKYTFYFHGARTGRKLDIIKQNNYAGFELDTNHKIYTKGDKACDYTARFQSIIGNGKITIIENSDEKIKALLELMKHNTGKIEWEFDERMVKAVCVFKLEVEEMSCKEHE